MNRRTNNLQNQRELRQLRAQCDMLRAQCAQLRAQCDILEIQVHSLERQFQTLERRHENIRDLLYTLIDTVRNKLGVLQQRIC